MSFSLRVPTIAFITGASRGIGRAIALQLSKRIDPAQSCLYLIARSETGLAETANLISKEIDVKCIQSDLSDEDDVKYLGDKLFNNIESGRYTHALLVHNAATVGPLDVHARDLHDVSDIQQYCLLNMTSVIVLTSYFLQRFRESNIRNTITQLTSRSAVVPHKTMHLYSMGKAAREMFFKVVALEEPGVRVMSYNPGFVSTDMYSSLQGSADEEFREMRRFVSNKSYFLTPEQSVEAMLKAVEDDQYVSGSTLSSYDLLNIDISEVLIHTQHRLM